MVTEGLTAVEAVVALVLQLYVVAPLAVKVEDWPTHIEVGLAVAVIVGVVFTVTLTVLVLAQPFVVPVTVYMVVTEGDTEIVAVVAVVLQL